MSYSNAQTALQAQAFDQLIAVGTIKGNQIEQYFGERLGDISVLSQEPAVIEAGYLDETGGLAEGVDILPGTAEFLTSYMAEYGYYDVFMISNDGDIYWTVCKEADYGTNLANGQYSDSGLAEVWKEARRSGSPELADFAFYAPSNEHASFVAAPIYHDNDLVGVVGLQLNVNQINTIMQERAGLGESGETYIVGADYYMRSDSRFSTESTIGEQKIETTGTQAALAGATGNEIYPDYRGVPVLGYYAPLQIAENVKWVVISEIDRSEAFAAVKALQNLVYIIIGGAGIAAAVAAFIIARSVSNPITRVIGVLTGNVAELTSSAQQVSSGTEQTTNAVQQMAKASQEQSVQIEGTSKILGDMSSSIQQASAASAAAAETSQNASTAAQSGSEAAAKGAEMMNNINTVVGESAEVIMDLGQKSDQIGEIVKTITSIAEQTNLLALNAAIEAARAGEAGRGFAVVADEVRKLAEEAGGAANQIADLVGEVQGSATNAVESMEKVTKDVEEGAAVVNDALVSLQGIATSIQDVAGKMQEISASAQQQSAGAQQVVSSVDQVAAAAEENASSAQQVSAASEQQMAAMQQITAAVDQVGLMVQDLEKVVGASGTKTEAKE